MKMIAVWGASGSGKSTIALATAHYITNEMKKNTILISADRTSPMFSTFMPTKEFKREYSLGAFLDGYINKENLKYKIHRHEKNKYLAFMSMGEEDSFQRYANNWTISKVKSMTELLNEYADYVVFDVTSNFIVDNFSLFALEYSDVVIDVYNADNKSTSFFETYGKLLQQDDRYSKVKHIKLLNNYFEYSGHIRYMTDFEIKYCVPNCRQLYESYMVGSDNILSGISKKSIECKATIQNVLKEVEQCI